MIFVDDLDRCLPANALQVLESMKLFFDLTGFVFVVGLDSQVVERAIEARYRQGQGADGATEPPIKGVDYIKKIFQVPFALPPISRSQLDAFLESIAPPQISPGQASDLHERVRPHLTHLVSDAGINPREVKRYLNAYTLQLRTRPRLDPDVVLCLQTMQFRPDWKEAYDVLLSERDVFTDAVRRRADGDSTAVENLWPELASVPESLFQYLETLPGRRLLEEQLLDPYLQSAEAAQATQPGLVESYRMLGKLRKLLREFVAAGRGEQQWQLRNEVLQGVKSLRTTIAQLSGGASAALVAEVEELSRRSELPRRTGDPGGEAELETWRRSAEGSLDRIQAHLRRLRDSNET